MQGGGLPPPVPPEGNGWALSTCTCSRSYIHICKSLLLTQVVVAAAPPLMLVTLHTCISWLSFTSSAWLSAAFWDEFKIIVWVKSHCRIKFMLLLTLTGVHHSKARKLTQVLGSMSFAFTFKMTRAIIRRGNILAQNKVLRLRQYLPPLLCRQT